MAVDAAIEKLVKAVDFLDAAVSRKAENETGLRLLEKELERMGDDRTRLAHSLDSAKARNNELESANREVSTRLVRAMESIRAVIDRQE